MTPRSNVRPAHRRHVARASVGVVFLAVALAGCAAVGPFAGATMLDPPTQVMEVEGVVDGTVRAIGTDDQGTAYFTFKASGQNEFCLMMIPQGEVWASACSARLPIALTNRDTRAVLHDAPVPSSADAVVVGDFVQVFR